MDKIVWSPSLSVGITWLDEQHKQIISMVNQLLADPQVTVRCETISELLTRLTRYANDHFKAEECLLAEHGYPELNRQKEEHKAFRIKIVAFCQDTMSHQDSVPADLHQFLLNWWKDHIMGLDIKYRSFLEERGIK